MHLGGNPVGDTKRFGLASVAFACGLVCLMALARAEAQLLGGEDDPPKTSETPESPPPNKSEKQPKPQAELRTAFVADVCRRIEAAAKERDLPPGFLARLIWKESRFDPDAVSPKGASGIAQFMPGTAALRGLEDPFDPRTAIPASAHYLSDLRAPVRQSGPGRGGLQRGACPGPPMAGGTQRSAARNTRLCPVDHRPPGR